MNDQRPEMVLLDLGSRTADRRVIRAQPDPAAAARRQAAGDAQLAAEHLARAVASAKAAGLVVDAELYEASATLFSWASWLGGAGAQDGP
jgi:hypothetical protein